MNKTYDVAIIGGGPAGLAAAIKTTDMGLKTVVIEAMNRLGGIPIQCIHPGFGLHYFKEDLTGPEFVYRFIDKVMDRDIDLLLETYVEEIINESMMSKKIKIISPKGSWIIESKAIIYAAGARERHRYEICIPGFNVAGVYTAGEAQAMMDLYGIMPGKKILIIGSGDVGLIMARRFVLEGAEVVGVVEILGYPSGLTRNIVQCLQDFGIPLLLRHTVIEIKANNGRVSSAIISEVDDSLNPIPGTEKEVECDTIIIAAGLRPRTKLLKKMGVLIDPRTRGPIVNDYLESISVPGVFIAGNALVINDYVDYAVEQGEIAAGSAYEYIENKGILSAEWRKVIPGTNILFVVPHYVSGRKDVILYSRVSRPLENTYFQIGGIGKKIPLIKIMPSTMLRIVLRKTELSKYVGDIVVEAVEE